MITLAREPGFPEESFVDTQICSGTHFLFGFRSVFPKMKK